MRDGYELVIDRPDALVQVGAVHRRRSAEPAVAGRGKAATQAGDGADPRLVNT